MEITETKTIEKSTGFINHVFNFNDDSKAEIFNIIQYSTLAFIPTIILIKAIQMLLPEPDENKGSIEILAEVLFQIIFMFLGLYIIHKLIVYVPTYSKVVYQEFNVTNIILAVLVIVLSLQTRLGEKSNILYLRIMDTIQGKTNLKKKTNEASLQKAPVESLNMNILPNPLPPQQIEQNISQIVPNMQPGMQSIQQQPTQQPQQQQQQQQQPMTNNPMPQGAGAGTGLMAANEALGGSFGSMF